MSEHQQSSPGSEALPPAREPPGDTARLPPGVPPVITQSPTLVLLKQLLDVSGRAAPAIARRAELSHSELAALELLMDRQRGPAELARNLGVTSAASSGIVDRLVARGHVVREPDQADRRRTRVLITDSARSEVVGHLMPMFLALQDLDASLTEGERAVVSRFLEGAIAAVRRLL